MEARIRNGDYLPDGQGGFLRAEGGEALLQRALLRLTARRGRFPFLPDFGSRLYLLGMVAPTVRELAAERYVTEALAMEDLTVEEVRLDEDGDLSVLLRIQGESYTLWLTTEGGVRACEAWKRSMSSCGRTARSAPAA